MDAPEITRDRFTYADYLKWPEGERWELIEGRAYAMTPGPTDFHQEVSMAFSQILANFFQGKPCRPYAAPFDVRLPEKNERDEEIETIVQPDLLVLCDLTKKDHRGVRGAPDLVIEILSESSLKHDQDIKLHLYEKHGVRCYIIADPYGKTLTVRYLETEGKYGRPELFSGNDQMPVKIFEGLVLDLSRIFADLQ